MKTSTWFCHYWIDQHQEEEIFDGYVESRDAINFLHQSIDLGIDDDFSYVESELEELVAVSI